MKAFLDTSVILRKLFNEPGPLAEWPTIEQAYASRLVALELGGVIHRYRLQGELDDESTARLFEESRRVLASVEIVALTEPILARAGGPLPTLLCSLDAIHLASALEVQRRLEPALVLATHDEQLGTAARASGLPVVGVPSV
jgi:predicted nucleic acid-binding protein